MNINKWCKIILLGSGILSMPNLMRVQAQSFHCANDTVKAMELVRKYHQPGKDAAPLCGEIASELVGVAYVPITQEDSVGDAQIRLDGFDEMAFVNTVGAIAKLSTSPGHSRPKDLGAILDNLTFRKGENAGFHTRMNYASDWILDNKARGNIMELTEDYSDSFKTKSLDYISRHRDEYAALKDSDAYDKLRMVEFGYRTFKVPHMRRESGDWKDVKQDLREGDLIVVLTNEQDKDIYNVGFLKQRADGMHLIYVSPKEGKVIEDSDPFGKYLKRNSKYAYGWRWLRLK